MVSLDYFIYHVNEAFSFLETDFGYSKCTCNEVHTIYECIFIKKNDMIGVIYSKKNNYLRINFYKDTDKFPPTTQDGRHSLGLETLIYRKKKRRIYCPEDYDDFMPSKLGFENSMEKVSSMLLEYGSDILRGKKWKGWEQND